MDPRIIWHFNTLSQSLESQYLSLAGVDPTQNNSDITSWGIVFGVGYFQIDKKNNTPVWPSIGYLIYLRDDKK